MKVLVINGGSSSFKYQLIEMDTETVLAKGLAERIGLEQGKISHEYWENGQKNKVSKEMHFDNHEVAFKEMAAYLTDEKIGVIQSISEIKYIGHRVVHGGKFTAPERVTPQVMEELRKMIPLAPLHNPASIIGIEAAQKIFPKETENFLVFDTAFHQTMPEKAFRYAIPNHFYTEDKIRRYGFHGISHKYVDERTRRHFNNPHLKNITLHLGNGASMAAVDAEGHCIDTSMGFTPLSGLVMGTRTGDIDPATIPYIAQKTGLSLEEIVRIFNFESGLKGVSGLSSDLRDVESVRDTNPHAAEAIDVYINRIKEYVGAYAAALNGVDAIVFTAGVGENATWVREEVLEGLTFLGVQVDKERNNVRGKVAEISTADSKVKAFVIPTDEEVMIARDTYNLSK